jgi:uncharacterized membrane protein (DUF4010 family)
MAKGREAAIRLGPSDPSESLQIPEAIIFAAIFVVISVVSAAIRDTFGQTGILTLAALLGITDIDPFVINIAQGGVRASLFRHFAPLF